MDVQMPEMDGVTATRVIRSATELGARARVPIIALTAHAMEGDRERFLEAGMDDHVAKPVQREELEAALRRLADRIR
jgi:CheY-like chemotaxis protein